MVAETGEAHLSAGDIEDGQWQRELGEAWRNPP